MSAPPAQLDPKTFPPAPSATQGVTKVVLSPGTGATPKKGQNVSCNVTGYLHSTGKKFWSTADTGVFSFNVGQGEVIKGWDHSLIDFRVGERSRVVIHSDWAYGPSGIAAWGIPPNATLVFDIELISVKPLMAAKAALNIDPSSQQKLTIAVLQRKDPSVIRIVDSSGHVALYNFDDSTQSWARSDVEGALHIVERQREPFFELIVINRLSPDNVTEAITADMQLQSSEPYIFYKNALTGVTRGLWFYNRDDRERLMRTLESLVQAAGNVPPRSAVPPAAAAAPPPLLGFLMGAAASNASSPMVSAPAVSVPSASTAMPLQQPASIATTTTTSTAAAPALRQSVDLAAFFGTAPSSLSTQGATPSVVTSSPTAPSATLTSAPDATSYLRDKVVAAVTAPLVADSPAHPTSTSTLPSSVGALPSAAATPSSTATNFPTSSTAIPISTAATTTTSSSITNASATSSSSGGAGLSTLSAITKADIQAALLQLAHDDAFIERVHRAYLSAVSK